MKLALTTFLMMSCSSLIAQELSTTPITINFSNLKKVILKNKAPKGSIIHLEIININRNEYNVQITSTQTDFFTTKPPVFSNLDAKAPDIADKTIIAQTPASNFAARITKDAISESIKTLNDKQGSFNTLVTQAGETLEKLKKAITVLRNSSLLPNRFHSLQENCIDTADKIIADAIAITSKFIADNGSGEIPAADVFGMKGQLQNILESNIKEASSRYEDLKNLATKAAEAAEEVQQQITDIVPQISAALQKKALKEADKDALNASQLIINKISNTVKADLNHINAVMTSINEANTWKESYVSGNQAASIITTLAQFNRNSFTVIKDEILEKDELLMDVVISPKSESTCANVNAHLPIRINTKGGFKIDFSSGLFMNFGKKDFFDQTYRKDAIEGDPDNVKVVKNENRNKILPSIGALMHAYIRTGGVLQPAALLGVSLSTGETARLNYHLGASLIIGRDQRFIASFGWTLGQANILDGKYQENQVIAKSDAPDTIPTTPTYRWGNFFALTYNLTH